MHITVIAKEPRPGFVKTRLCPPCTQAEAAALAAASLADTLDAVDEVHARLCTALGSGPRRVLLFDGDASDWTRDGWDVVRQRGGDLAERLDNGFVDLGPGLIVGMETPHAVASLTGAMRALHAGCDAIGLAADGGYWVIGLHRHDGVELSGIPMSTSATGLIQLRRLHELRRSVRLLPLAHDLDTITDVERAAGRAEGTRLAAAAAEVVTRIA